MVEEPAWPILKNGDRGPNVKALQFLLQNQGYSNVTADSEFGLVTQSAVADFQNSHSLNADGMAGEYILEKLTENYEIYYPTQGLAAKAGNEYGLFILPGYNWRSVEHPRLATGYKAGTGL